MIAIVDHFRQDYVQEKVKTKIKVLKVEKRKRALLNFESHGHMRSYKNDKGRDYLETHDRLFTLTS
jgi:hypothetical protein